MNMWSQRMAGEGRENMGEGEYEFGRNESSFLFLGGAEGAFIEIFSICDLRMSILFETLVCW